MIFSRKPAVTEKERSVTGKLSGTDILFYAEDPGAANYLVHLPKTCLCNGFSSRVIADGAARKCFLEGGLDFEELGTSGSVRETVEKLLPRLVVVGTSENRISPGLSLVEEARIMGIPTVGVVDAFMNAGYRFRGLSNDPLRYCPDWIMVPDEWTKAAFLSLGCEPERIEICGHPQYDFVRSRGKSLAKKGKDHFRTRHFPDAEDGRIVAVFAAEISEGLHPAHSLPNGEYTLTGRVGTNRRTDIVLEEFLDALETIGERPYLVLRLHPKNEEAEFSQYSGSFDRVSKKEPVLELIYGADCVVGMTSMLLLEAAILGKPTFSIVPRESERDWLPTVRAGLTGCAFTRQQILSQLPSFFNRTSAGKDIPRADTLVFGSLERSLSFLNRLLS